MHSHHYHRGVVVAVKQIVMPGEPPTDRHVEMRIDLRLTEDEYRALEFVLRYIPKKGKLSTIASSVLHRILLHATPDGAR